jgi:uracil phosphoribosyltransferase
MEDDDVIRLLRAMHERLAGHLVPGMTVPLLALRDRMIETAVFRAESLKLCSLLVQEGRERLKKHGVAEDDVIVVPILRSGMAFLEPARLVFPDAPVGMLGMKRDERTLVPQWYYENLPKLSAQSTVVILDPMLATGGSASAAVARLVERGAAPGRIYFIGIIAAPEGYAELARHIPEENIILAAVDEKLDAHGYIVPGLGDFGDRYFCAQAHLS